MTEHPFISIIIPTLNEEKNIGNCLSGIFSQNYPKDKFEVLVMDRNSADRTAEIAESFGARVIKNDLPIEEQRKPLGVKLAKGEIVCFIDADNILADKSWLAKMAEPFQDKEIVASETLFYSCRPTDNFITRYCAYLGGDDPIAVYLRMGDRWCSFLRTWTLMPHEEEDKGGYVKVTLQPNAVPAMGSNGFLVRKEALAKIPHDPFVHPLVVRELVAAGFNKIAKVKTGLIHIQEGPYKFFKKKVRRIVRRHNKEIDWSKYNYEITKFRLASASLYAGSFFLPLKDAIIGAAIEKDIAWLFHPVACVGTLALYGFHTLKARLAREK